HAVARELRENVAVGVHGQEGGVHAVDLLPAHRGAEELDAVAGEFGGHVAQRVGGQQGGVGRGQLHPAAGGPVELPDAGGAELGDLDRGRTRKRRRRVEQHRRRVVYVVGGGEVGPAVAVEVPRRHRLRVGADGEGLLGGE